MRWDGEGGEKVTTRLQLKNSIRLLLADTTVWPDASLNSWIEDAIRDYSRYFQRQREVTFPAVAGVRDYSLEVLNDQVLGVIFVQFPAQVIPPRYVVRMALVDRRFYGGPTYDVVSNGWIDFSTLWLGEMPKSGDYIRLRFETVHAIPTGDDYVLTVPDPHLEALRLFVIWKALQKLELAEAGANSIDLSVSLPMLGMSASKAERLYKEKISDLQGFELPGGVTGPWEVDR
jgi:hypothetical protein